MKDMLLFNIQRFSTHDGPGIRTTVFFKGCPLKCRWCHNPESQSFEPVVFHNSERCVMCGKCVSNCPERAISFWEKTLKTDFSKCKACGICAEECYNCAREVSGKKYSASGVMDVVCRDKTFYGESGGGVTFSGGECLSQIEPLTQLLELCRKQGIHTAVDTCGFAKWEDLEKTLPFTNLYLYDIKCVDAQKHKSLTGADNALILENLRELKRRGAEIWLRLPLIKGVNDTDEDIAPLIEIAKEIRPQRVSLLPYHNTGNFKYAKLNRAAEEFAPPENERLTEIAHMFENNGLTAKIGS